MSPNWKKEFEMGEHIGGDKQRGGGITGPSFGSNPPKRLVWSWADRTISPTNRA